MSLAPLPREKSHHLIETQALGFGVTHYRTIGSYPTALDS